MKRDCALSPKGKPWSRYQLDRCKDLYETKGLTIPGIAHACQTTPANVIALAQQYGWKRNSRTISKPKMDVDWAVVRKQYETSDIPVAMIAKKIGQSPASLIKRAMAEGWIPRERSRFGKKDKPGKAVEYAPHLQQAITKLRRNDIVVYRRGSDFMVGTKVLTEAALLEKAERYGA